jgi:hypothetical protein
MAHTIIRATSGIEALGGEDATDLGLVVDKVVGRFGDAEAKDKGTAPRPSHVVETGTCAEVMAAASASAQGGTLTRTAVGQEVTTGAND